MIEDKELELTAELAQIELSADDSVRLRKAVTRMVDYFATMSEVDVDDLPPMTHVHADENRTRPDTEHPLADSDTLLKNAGDLEDRFITIPNVL